MIKYEELTADLILQNFPELSANIQKQISFWDSIQIPPHCLYGDAFNQYLFDLLKSYDCDTLEMIQRIFQFYEHLVTEGDDDVKNVVQVTLLEYLWDDYDVYHRALYHMGENTFALNEELNIYLNIPKKCKEKNS